MRQFLSNTIIGEKIKKVNFSLYFPILIFFKTVLFPPKQGNKRQSMPPVECSRSNLFKRIGSLIITKSNVWRDCFEFNDVPPLFPIEGWFSVQLKCRSDCSIQQRGYLTILQQVVGHVPTLNRKWCLLSEDKLRFWKGYNDEKIKVRTHLILIKKWVIIISPLIFRTRHISLIYVNAFKSVLFHPMSARDPRLFLLRFRGLKRWNLLVP